MGRRNIVLTILVLVMIGGTAGCASRQPGIESLPPGEALSVVRSQIVDTAKIVENGYQGGLIDEPTYLRLKKVVETARNRYNSMMRTYLVLNTVAVGERQQVLAVLLAVAQEVTRTSRGDAQ